MSPRRAAVGALVEAAVAAGTPQRPHGRHPDHVAVARVHLDLADVHRLLQPPVPPALAAVQR
ncbi:MAG: hypothetical protein ACOC28_08030, partial [Alkalispirochaetaceae bacterium]